MNFVFLGIWSLNANTDVFEYELDSPIALNGAVSFMTAKRYYIILLVVKNFY